MNKRKRKKERKADENVNLSQVKLIRFIKRDIT